MIIGAWYMLWLYQRIFFNPVNNKVVALLDLNNREILTLCPMVALVFWVGVYPNFLLSFMHASVAHLLEQVVGNPALTATALAPLARTLGM